MKAKIANRKAHSDMTKPRIKPYAAMVISMHSSNTAAVSSKMVTGLTSLPTRASRSVSGQTVSVKRVLMTKMFTTISGARTDVRMTSELMTIATTVSTTLIVALIAAMIIKIAMIVAIS